MATRKKENGANRLEEAMAHLIQSQAALAEQQTAFLARLSETDKELAELRRESIALRRENAERFARIEAILLRHEQILQGLPEAIREKIGFKPTK
jgi:hypothetical protein